MPSLKSLSLLAFIVIVGYPHADLLAQEPETQYEESFNIVWQTIDARFYDPEFNGVDWNKSREQYYDKTASAVDDDEFYEQINTMLFELGVSHLGVVPTNDTQQLGEAAVFGEATVGLDVRFVNGQLLVVKVENGSSSDLAGIRAGDELVSINSHSVDDIREEALRFHTPPFHERNDRYMVLNEIYWELIGALSEQVSVSFKNGDDRISEVLLRRHKRSDVAVFEEGLPPTYVTSTYEILDGNIGYLKFSTFHPALLDEMDDALSLFADTKGLIIDLRGNPGGAFGVRFQLASRFVSEPTLIWRYRGPGGIDDIVLEPRPQPYLSPLVILVDGLSASSSEEFSGGLQAMKRATIVGMRTPGRDLVADIAVLPVGAYFVFPVAETMTSDGTVLESRGVIPDIEVAHTPESLSAGRDVQLEAAIQYLGGLSH